MARLLALLMLLTFAASNAVAAPMALCEHADAKAHAAALASSDAAEAAAAHGEEAAAATADQDGSLAEAAAVAMGSGLLPTHPVLSTPAAARAVARRPAEANRLAGRATPPLLEPPLA